jgi:hypothetical protein
MPFRATWVVSLLALCSLLFVSNAAAETLSNETTFTRWAYPVETGAVTQHAGGKGRTITRLHYKTEDGLPELYVGLQTRVVDGVTWAQIRLPRRPNNSTGWVRRSDLGPWKLIHTQLVINRVTLTATLYKNNHRIFHARVGVGKAGTPTPGGNFYVREKLHGFKSNPVYGPRVMALSAYAPTLSDWPGGGIIGIHGTNEPGLIPGRPSHGCIRLKNRDVLRLYPKVPLGTPVLII